MQRRFAQAAEATSGTLADRESSTAHRAVRGAMFWAVLPGVDAPHRLGAAFDRATQAVAGAAAAPARATAEPSDMTFASRASTGSNRGPGGR